MPEHDFFASEPFAKTAQRNHLQQFFTLLGHSPETVDQVVAVTCQVVVVADIVEFTIQQHTLAAARHILFGQIHLKVALYGTVFHKVVARQLHTLCHLLLIHVAELIVFQFGDRLTENLLIGFITQVLHESALLRPEQIAGTTDVEVLHGEIESAAQFGKSLQGLQTSACLLCQHRAWRCQQIAEGLAVAAPHTSAHLMKVRQTEMVGIVDDDGIGIADVDAVFHDGG